MDATRRDERMVEGDGPSGLAQAVLRLRNEHLPSLSLREVAARGGLSKDYVASVESGRVRNPTPEKLGRLARGLGVPAVELLVAMGYLARGAGSRGVGDDDPGYAAALRRAAGLRDRGLRRLIAHAIADAAELDGRLTGD